MAGSLRPDPKPKKRKRRGWLHRLFQRQRPAPAPLAPMPPLVDDVSHIRPGVWVVVQGPDGERIGTVRDYTSFYVRWLDENEQPIGEPFAVHRGGLIEQGTRVRFPDSGKLGQIIEFSAVSIDVQVPAKHSTITATREQIRPARLADLPVTVRERTPAS